MDTDDTCTHTEPHFDVCSDCAQWVANNEGERPPFTYLDENEGDVVICSPDESFRRSDCTLCGMHSSGYWWHAVQVERDPV